VCSKNKSLPFSRGFDSANYRTAIHQHKNREETDTSCLAVSEAFGFLLLKLLQNHGNLVVKTGKRQLELHSNSKLNV